MLWASAAQLRSLLRQCSEWQNWLTHRLLLTAVQDAMQPECQVVRRSTARYVMSMSLHNNDPHRQLERAHHFHGTLGRAQQRQEEEHEAFLRRLRERAAANDLPATPPAALANPATPTAAQQEDDPDKKGDEDAEKNGSSKSASDAD
jgi:hypothetical protein